MSLYGKVWIADGIDGIANGAGVAIGQSEGGERWVFAADFDQGAFAGGMCCHEIRRYYAAVGESGRL